MRYLSLSVYGEGNTMSNELLKHLRDSIELLLLDNKAKTSINKIVTLINKFQPNPHLLDDYLTNSLPEIFKILLDNLSKNGIKKSVNKFNRYEFDLCSIISSFSIVKGDDYTKKLIPSNDLINYFDIIISRTTFNPKFWQINYTMFLLLPSLFHNINGRQMSILNQKFSSNNITITLDRDLIIKTYSIFYTLNDDLFESFFQHGFKQISWDLKFKDNKRCNNLCLLNGLLSNFPDKFTIDRIDYLTQFIHNNITNSLENSDTLIKYSYQCYAQLAIISFNIDNLITLSNIIKVLNFQSSEISPNLIGIFAENFAKVLSTVDVVWRTNSIEYLLSSMTCGSIENVKNLRITLNPNSEKIDFNEIICILIIFQELIQSKSLNKNLLSVLMLIINHFIKFDLSLLNYKTKVKLQLTLCSLIESVSLNYTLNELPELFYERSISKLIIFSGACENIEIRKKSLTTLKCIINNNNKDNSNLTEFLSTAQLGSFLEIIEKSFHGFDYLQIPIKFTWEFTNSLLKDFEHELIDSLLTVKNFKIANYFIETLKNLLSNNNKEVLALISYLNKKYFIKDNNSNETKIILAYSIAEFLLFKSIDSKININFENILDDLTPLYPLSSKDLVKSYVHILYAIIKIKKNFNLNKQHLMIFDMFRFNDELIFDDLEFIFKNAKMSNYFKEVFIKRVNNGNIILTNLVIKNKNLQKMFENDLIKYNIIKSCVKKPFDNINKENLKLFEKLLKFDEKCNDNDNDNNDNDNDDKNSTDNNDNDNDNNGDYEEFGFDTRKIITRADCFKQILIIFSNSLVALKISSRVKFWNFFFKFSLTDNDLKIDKSSLSAFFNIWNEKLTDNRFFFINDRKIIFLNDNQISQLDKRKNDNTNHNVTNNIYKDRYTIKGIERKNPIPDIFDDKILDINLDDFLIDDFNEVDKAEFTDVKESIKTLTLQDYKRHKIPLKNKEVIKTNEVTIQGNENLKVCIKIYPNGKKASETDDSEQIKNIAHNKMKSLKRKEEVESFINELAHSFKLELPGNDGAKNVFQIGDYWRTIIVSDIYRGIFEGEIYIGKSIGLLFESNLNFSTASDEKLNEFLKQSRIEQIHPFLILLLINFAESFIEKKIDDMFWENKLKSLSTSSDNEIVRKAAIESLEIINRKNNI